MKKLLVLLIAILPLTGCFKRDSMEDIDIYTSVYPIEYIMNALYGNNSTVYSIYPNGIIIDDYTLTDKQIKDYSNCSLFAFNGLGQESKYIVDMFKYNKNIKIIDTTSSMEYEYGMEELWLNPSNLLMMAQNIKMGLNEYISNHYLLTEIEENYEKLKIDVSNLDAEMRLMAEEAKYDTILVSSDLYKFLGKYGLNIISLEENDNLTDKVLAQVKQMITDGKIKYIFASQHSDPSDTINQLVKDYKVEIVYIHTLSNITETERNDKKDYLSLMRENIELWKKELNK